MPEPVVIQGWRPLSTSIGSNARHQHWGVKTKVVRPIRKMVGCHLTWAGWRAGMLPERGRGWVIKFTAIQGGGGVFPDPGDNREGAFKIVRDAVCSFLQVPDDGNGPEFRYDWQRGKTACLIELVASGEG